MNLTERNDLVMCHDDLVITLARKMYHRLPPNAEIQLDDLESAAREANIHAVDTWNPWVGELKRWVTFKVRRELLEELRIIDPLSRTHRRKIKEGVWHKIVFESWEWRELSRQSRDVWAASRWYPSEIVIDDPTDAVSVRQALAVLTPRQQVVVNSIYWGGKLQREVADELEVTESRVNQILRNSYDRMRQEL